MSEPTPEIPAPEPGPSLADALAAAGGADALQRLALLRADQHRRWRRGERLLVEAYLDSVPALRDDAETLLDLIYSEVLLREEAGEHPEAEEYACAASRPMRRRCGCNSTCTKRSRPTRR